MKRLKKRKNSGYLIFTYLERPDENEAESHILESLNYLLKEAMKICLPDFPLDALRWTTIRHTEFRLTLEKFPSLGIPPEINAFADNGHTSPQKPRETYLIFLKWKELLLKDAVPREYYCHLWESKYTE